MAEPDSQKDLTEARRESVFVGGGGEPSCYLLESLTRAVEGARSIDVIVAFLRESGVKMLLPLLKKELWHIERIRVLSGDTLDITEPSALLLLLELGEKVQIRFCDTKKVFHPKAYMFWGMDGEREIFIGSSNISRSALTVGFEWNYRLDGRLDADAFERFAFEFETLFSERSRLMDEAAIGAYAKSRRVPPFLREIASLLPSTCAVEPRGAQIEALLALRRMREEGASKALVQAATGVGKTFIAAFDSRGFSRVLFVAHREEILRQAALSFALVQKKKSIGFFDGHRKDTREDIIFASVSTLGRDEHRQRFSKEHFDYIVVDECHHAVARQYEGILSHFTPKFLLGLTATPERLDGRDVYALCDYNVAYEISLLDSIQRGLLSPFRYYGIYDETDYSSLHLYRGRYREEDLDTIYLSNRPRYDAVIRSYLLHRSSRALGFCCSKRHAAAMADAFAKEGIASASTYSGTIEGDDRFLERQEAIRALENGSIRVLFAVDMFNEGVDIPSLDMVLFLRPTQSPTIFLQQLGRGLRLAPNKKYLTVLDFIGNYQGAERIPSLVFGTSAKMRFSSIVKEVELPDGCFANFDLRLIDIFEALQKRREGARALVMQEFERIESMLGRIPTRVDLFCLMDENVYAYCLAHPKESLFKNYLSLDAVRKSLDPALLGTAALEFLEFASSTRMTKIYKMPVLQAFIDGEGMRGEVDEKRLLAVWKRFFAENGNWRDLADGFASFQRITDKEHRQNMLKNPVRFLKESGAAFFQEKEGSSLALSEALLPFLRNPPFVAQYQDILRYRILAYYKSRYGGRR